MKSKIQPSSVLWLSLCAALSATAALAAPAAEEKGQPAQVDMAAMMAQAKKFTAPGEHHKALERFLGTWDTTTRFTMAGMPETGEKGVAKVSWLIEGRWLKSEAKGTLMGMPSESFSIIGYDNFKQSYVTVTVGNFDTAMLTSEGDMDPSGKALLAYGTLDEYLTGEHDKMVKYVWRFVSDDEVVFEVHDLPIGEHNTQVIEMRFKRRSGEGGNAP